MRETSWKRFLEKALKFPFSTLQKQKSIYHAGTGQTANGSDTLCLGPSAMFIYELSSGRFMEMESGVLDITGIPAEEFLQKKAAETIAEMADASHIESIGYFIKKSFEYFTGAEKESSVSANIEHNIVSRNGTRKRILVQYKPSGYDDCGQPRYNLGCMTDITHMVNDGLPKLYLFQNNKLVLEENANPEIILKESDIPLSKTEIKIVQLISEGYIAKEIADKMEISISTLYTHRKNIKSKMGQDINRIISFLKGKGIICQLSTLNLLEGPEQILPLL